MMSHNIFGAVGFFLVFVSLIGALFLPWIYKWITGRKPFR